MPPQATVQGTAIQARDIFEYGLRFVIDGFDHVIIEKILSNIISQERDEQAKTLKPIQKETVLMIREGMNPRLLLLEYTYFEAEDGFFVCWFDSFPEDITQGKT